MHRLMICLMIMVFSPICAGEQMAAPNESRQAPSAVSLQPLNLDPSFAGDGTLEHQLRLNDYGAAGFIEPTGEAVIFGYSDNGTNGSDGEAIMLRLAADGAIGPLAQFDSQGFGCSAPRSFNSALRLTDGSYLGGGYIQTNCNGVPRFFNILQLDPDGSRIQEFDQVVFNNQLAYVFGMAEQADGKVVAAGLVSGAGFNATTYDFGVARFLPDGTLDTSFANGGTFTFDFDGDRDHATDVIVDRQGRIVATGFGTVNGTADLDIIVLGLTSEGALDASFGNGGVFRYDRAGFSDRSGGIAQHVGGRIFVAGTTSATETAKDFSVLGLTEDGVLDPAFSDDGLVTVDFGTPVAGASSVTVGRTGRVYVTGSGEFGGTGLASRDALVAVLRADGEMDSSFNNGQGVAFTFGEQPTDLSQSIAVDNLESKILVTGFTENAERTVQRVGVARLVGIGQAIFADSLESTGSSAPAVGQR